MFLTNVTVGLVGVGTRRTVPVKPREVKDFPKRGNHIGDLIRLPSGQVYEWIAFKRWQRSYLNERT